MDNKNTIVYVNVKGDRPIGFDDPPSFEWNVEKERQLWAIVSKLDNYQDQIDWKDLSRSLKAPDYFLKKRSYKLFAKHLKLLEQQIERKMKANNNDESAQVSIHQFEPSKHYPLSNQSSLSEQNLIEEQYVGIQDSDNAEDTTLKTLQQLHTSKLLYRGKLPSGNGKTPRKNSTGQNNNSDSEVSSSLSVSNSALEEALMDRLQL